MNWLFYAILSPAIYTIVIYVDRYIVEREIPRPLAIPIYSAIVAVISGTIFFLLGGRQTLPLGDALLVMLTGAFTTWGAVLYFEAIASAQTSSVIVLFQMVPVLVLIMSFVFLGERITLIQGLGFILILAATVIVSLEPDGGGIRLSRAFFLVMGVDLLWAGTAVIFKFVSEGYEFLHLAAYESFGLAAGGVILLIVVGRIRREFIETLTLVRKQAFALLGFNESLFVAAKITNLLAIALGPVALVSVLGGTSVFFGFIAGWGLTLIAPAIFKEDIRRHILLRKGLMSVVVIVGVYLVS